MTQNYELPYHAYPIYSQDLGFEGATKRYKTMPTPKDVFDQALMGVPKFFPLTKEPITPEMAATYLENAIAEIEMSLNIDITPVNHFQSFDYIDGMFEANFTGMKLERWPAWKIESLELKFPHTQTLSPSQVVGSDTTTPRPYQTYSIPRAWVALRRNRINVIAAFGAISVQTDATQVASAGGIFSYITGFGRGAYQPAMIECKYTAGFPVDQLPSSVWDLIVTLATIRFLENVAPLIFPFNSVTNTIDSVSQTASYTQGILLSRIDVLRKKYQDLVNAITRHFGRTIKLAFIGA